MICSRVFLEHPNFIPTNGSIPVIIARSVALFGPLDASCLLYLLVSLILVKPGPSRAQSFLGFLT